MIEFHSHASGSSGNFYTVTDGGHTLAIEAGIKFKDIQKATGFKVASLDGCLISHSHGDHSRSVKDVLKAGVNCYASAQSWDLLGIGAYRHREITKKHGESFGIASLYDGEIWRIHPFGAQHDAPGTLGFVIDGVSGDRLVYLTDSCFSKFTWDNVNILAIECNHSEAILKANLEAGVIDAERYKRTLSTHMSLERLLELLAANDLSRCREIVLLHLSDANSHAEDFKRQVQSATGIPCRVA